ncbi:MAG TPA: hypothetical protein PKD53_05280 [Chloroflexaceae bacterium]|nr:hypothetical protein [Chloroflexaceae bacterium]
MARRPMAYRKRERPTAAELEADRAFIRWLEAHPEYHPTNPEFSLERLQKLEAALDEAEEAERRAKQAFERVVHQHNLAVFELYGMTLGVPIDPRKLAAAGKPDGEPKPKVRRQRTPRNPPMA